MASKKVKQPPIKKFKSSGSISSGSSGKKISSGKHSKALVVGHYFMGRLNPPHKGHINAILQAIIHSRENNTTPLILLGNGPTLKEHKPTPAGRTTQIIDESFDTLDNPISYDLKKRFIEYRLPIECARLGIEPIDPSSYLIIEKENPGKQVFEYITCKMRKLQDEHRSELSDYPIEIYNVAGNKEDDTTKLDFISTAAIAAVQQFIPEYDDPILSMAIDAGENPMSATKVRLSIYKQLLPDIYPPTEESEQKLLEYAEFYGKLWPEIHHDILTVARPFGEYPKILQLYIECNGDKENLKNLLKASKGKAEAPPSKLHLLGEANAQALGLATQGKGFTKKRSVKERIRYRQLRTERTKRREKLRRKTNRKRNQNRKKNKRTKRR